jgi:putative hemolysin
MPFEPIFAPIIQGNLIVRLAEDEAEMNTAQRLRYRIFCEEMGGKANPEVQRQKRDFDKFDDVCDHMLVIDDTRPVGDKVVGTYRLITRPHVKDIGHFYSESEYDVACIKAWPGEILELGRSCVEVPYRTRPVLQLLWKGIGAYIVAKNIEVMFGCASFTGTQIREHQLTLAYLYHNHLAPEALRPKALPDQYINMNLMAKEAIDARSALVGMPPLIKGYLRLGGYIGEGAVIDHAYNTTDVSIVVKTDAITGKYAQRYMNE